MLAMHMANELLTPAVAAMFILLAAGVLAVASWRTTRGFEPAKVPLMGVMGAFVFAAQMINFPLLIMPVSGHLGGGVLLAILLGPHAATLVMASILVVQCLIFQDGGLLALGTNILNIGIIPCYLGYLIFHGLAGVKPGAGRLYAAVFVATMIGMLAGAAMVPVEVAISGLAAVPFLKFLEGIIGVHLLVALGEAIITFLVLGYLSKARPQVLGPVAEKLVPASAGLSSRAVLISLAVVAVLLAGIVSHFASEFPDALESRTSLEERPDSAMVKASEDPAVARVSEFQQQTAPLPDYEWTTVSGIVGAGLTLLIVWGIGVSLRRQRNSSAMRPTSAE